MHFRLVLICLKAAWYLTSAVHAAVAVGVRGARGRRPEVPGRRAPGPFAGARDRGPGSGIHERPTAGLTGRTGRGLIIETRRAER